MRALLCTIALLVVAQSSIPLLGTKAELVCEWVKSDKTSIRGGDHEQSAKDVPQCQQICLTKGYCKSVDWDIWNRCWLLITTAGQVPSQDVTHYDYICKVNKCTPNPCQNQGVCRQGATQDTYICTCSGGWSDPTCSTPPNPCNSSPCKNGGNCRVGSSYNIFMCDCVNGFSGPTCETAPRNPCISSPCKNGAECDVGSSYHEFVCDCVDGFSGPTCETAPPDPCSNSPCKNGAECYVGSNINEFECDCVNGYSGPTCNSPPSDNEDVDTETDDVVDPGCRAREIFRNPDAMSCVHSNYPGRNLDLYNKPEGFSWEYRLPRFKFDWPFDIRGRRITRMFFQKQTNLHHYRAVIIHGNNQRFESKSVTGPLVFEGINSIKSVAVFFAPLDMEEELTISGFQIRHCPLRGICEPREIFDRVRDVDVAYQGLINNEPKIGAAGLSWNTSMILPHVDVNLNCLGYDSPEIFRIGVKAILRSYRTHVKIWNNNQRVPITNILGQITEYFNFRLSSPTNVNSMRFKRGKVYGDRLRVTFIPPRERVTGIKVRIWWRSFFVKICT